MAEQKKEVIDLSGTTVFGPEDLRAELRGVRALIVDMLGYGPDVNAFALSKALYVIQYLAEDVEYKQK